MLDRENEAARKLAEILSDPRFATRKPLGLLDYIASFLRDISEKINELIKKLNPDINAIIPNNGTVTEGTPGVLKITAAVIVFLAVGLISFFIIRNLRRSRRILEKEDAEILSTVKNPETVLDKALSFYNDMQYRQAVRFLYLSLLLKLNEINVIRIDRAKTNRQYLKEAGTFGFRHIDILEHFTAVFETCWYGGKAAGKEIFDYWYEKYRTMLS